MDWVSSKKLHSNALVLKGHPSSNPSCLPYLLCNWFHHSQQYEANKGKNILACQSHLGITGGISISPRNASTNWDSSREISASFSNWQNSAVDVDKFQLCNFRKHITCPQSLLSSEEHLLPWLMCLVSVLSHVHEFTTRKLKSQKNVIAKHDGAVHLDVW